jgi:hypothetical protein
MTTEELPIKVLSKQEFAMQIERRVQRKEMGYLEAIIDYCDDHGFEADDIYKLVVGSLKEKLEAEAQRNNLLPKTSTGAFG